jgi:hypothetical protein
VAQMFREVLALARNAARMKKPAGLSALPPITSVSRMKILITMSS